VSQPTIAVVGAAGFIGSALVRRCETDGVVCQQFTRARPFRTDLGELAPPLAYCDVVYWLASSIRPAVARAEASQADLGAFRSLLGGLASRAGKGPARRPRIVMVSSGGTVYDPTQPPPYSELAATKAVNDYGRAMLTLETELRERWPEHVVIRASNVYGPGQLARRGQGVIAHWFEAIATGTPIRVIGDPDSRRDYVFVDDLVAALISCGRDPSAPQTINIGSGIGTSLTALSNLVVSTAGRAVTVERASARSFDAPSTWLDISLAERSLGWRPRVALPEGLRRTWRVVCNAENRIHLSPDPAA
jgi:UDP-glucose 4-epimerase